VLESNTFADVTVNPVPAVLELTDKTPTFVNVAAVSVRNITLLAVTAAFVIVAVPLDNVPVPAVIRLAENNGIYYPLT
jgi:hypothetical protein